MAFPVAKHQQIGASLIEFMIASLVGVMALAIIGSVFISNQRVALQRSQEIMLQQQMSMVMHQLKRDVLRAGYNYLDSYSLQFIDKPDLISVTDHSIGYVYYIHNHSAEKFSHTLYRLDSSSLKYCQANYLIPQSTASMTRCFNLFDPKQVRVTQFSVKRFPINGQAVQSAVISIDISASLVANPAVAHSMQLHITQRNWQS
ncbi:pilus assembly protein PilW [Vibrio metschnikovii]|uniref:Pilus assembly protein PilW n=1 Tax=bacterium 19MO02SH05 TaxID=2920696 RepID=A0AAU6TG87_UNCXX|nr:pilus assembly protein PilW [Vibrio metschnikovii]EKO3591895.1 pilus assembly protein PilW [Vibrio metschnikovii]EKO3666565.1 pilus assembly protein PilW [Vibrio metschnikovii]EKO3697074.1 pilus assembly protein PilW [Vibrio metschnikovii]EKO3718183.1 pilus assembly protein PilW [Vibrio metschnikovii]